MFESLRQYQRIYVTGPQRSGTTICSKMIALDTGYQCIDEIDYGFTNCKNFAALQSLNKIVVQCPIHCYHIEDCSDDETLIVMMKRPINEIIRSQKRITWKFEPEELRRYNKTLKDSPIAKVKYDHWETQKKDIRHYREIHYHSLQRHPLWVDNRKDFDCKQTKHYIAICDNQLRYQETRKIYANRNGYQYHYERHPPEKLKLILEKRLNWVVYLTKSAIFNPNARIEQYLDDTHDIILIDDYAILFRVCDWCKRLVNTATTDEITKIVDEHIKRVPAKQKLFIHQHKNAERRQLKLL